MAPMLHYVSGMNTTNTPAMTDSSKLMTVDCGRCGGTGRFYFRSGSDVCFGCNGRRKVRITRARYEAGQVARERQVAAMAQELQDEAAELACYHDASFAISVAATRVEGARTYFAAHRSDVVALGALIGAMRDVGLVDESNAVVRHRNTLANPRGI